VFRWAVTHVATVAGEVLRTAGIAAEDLDVFGTIAPQITKAVEEAAGKGVTDTHQLQQVVRRTVGSYVGGKLRRRPMIIPVVIEA